jgi:hypothetical protein
MDSNLILALASGVGLAAAAGLRAFLPLLAVGLAARFGLLQPRPGLEWLASDPALWALGTATALELLADKIPLLDHALDALGTVLRPAAAALGAYAVLGHWGSPWAQLAAIALGAGALAVHGAKAHARLGSTALTLGHANPFLSGLEDLLALLLVATALLLPVLALLLVVAAAWVLVRRRARARSSAPGGSAGGPPLCCGP